MFCTGGIRCEKASSFMLKEGFEEVYHLKGGVLNYLERCRKSSRCGAASASCSITGSLCAMISPRASTSSATPAGCRSLRKTCSRRPTSPASAARTVSTHCLKTRAAARERQRQIELAKARGEPHPLGYNHRQGTREKA